MFASKFKTNSIADFSSTRQVESKKRLMEQASLDQQSLENLKTSQNCEQIARPKVYKVHSKLTEKINKLRVDHQINAADV